MFTPDRLRWTMIGGATAIGLVSAAAVVVSGWQQQNNIAVALTGGEPSRAPTLLRRYGCSSCHTIPGAPGGDGLVGPSLRDLRSRVYLAGVLPNTADNLVRFIVSPTRFHPASAMPETGISEREARDVAAYLYAQ
jgi:cytochrome c